MQEVLEKLVTKIKLQLGLCVLVGTDPYGNQYYMQKKTKNNKRIKRWVIYKGQPEGSKVPPGWHAWLHYMSHEIPENVQQYAWQKLHLPNLTGTSLAYKPEPDRFESGGSYKRWTPLNKREKCHAF